MYGGQLGAGGRATLAGLYLHCARRAGGLQLLGAEAEVWALHLRDVAAGRVGQEAVTIWCVEADAYTKDFSERRQWGGAMLFHAAADARNLATKKM